MHSRLRNRRDGQTDRQTDGQTAFQLYIVDCYRSTNYQYIHNYIMYLCKRFLKVRKDGESVICWGKLLHNLIAWGENEYLYAYVFVI